MISEVQLRIGPAKNHRFDNKAFRKQFAQNKEVRKEVSSVFSNDRRVKKTRKPGRPNPTEVIKPETWAKLNQVVGQKAILQPPISNKTWQACETSAICYKRRRRISFGSSAVIRSSYFFVTPAIHHQKFAER